MKCSEIAAKLEETNPEYSAMEIAQLCTPFCNLNLDPANLKDNEKFVDALSEINLRVCACTEQHDAVAEELESLTSSDPKDFSAEQIWVLVRAIKVQSQLLKLYTGDAGSIVA